ncbi:AtpZ/AtpI family protein [Pedobacter sp. SD-b]|uniref:AtpZ/AtpI family protein n=1 Tax=Pedobacter segetis TaxID=2793069 RepID=A0ABS1BIS0_9SPHI|nr:AtpZ/AtpI family protein [Pedobacter segetis]MBK0382742.1 AtpZ/AtpI family protein [Pedobacter segetis]
MDQKQSEKERQRLNSYAKYSSLGFQMVGIIGVFTFIGYKIDESTQNQTPYYTAGFSLLGVAISLYFVFKALK